SSTRHSSLVTRHFFMNLLGLFRRQIQVARVSGIPVRIDYRWFVVFALSAWVIALSFREGTTITQFVRLGEGWAWAAGVATTLARLDALAASLSIVGFWNFTIAASNLLPGYPLDGGRVLRAYLWKRTGQLEDATRAAALGGQLIGGALVVFGGYFYMVWRDPF